MFRYHLIALILLSLLHPLLTMLSEFGMLRQETFFKVVKLVTMYANNNHVAYKHTVVHQVQYECYCTPE